jgi:hypothetical protein
MVTVGRPCRQGRHPGLAGARERQRTVRSAGVPVTSGSRRPCALERADRALRRRQVAAVRLRLPANVAGHSASADVSGNWRDVEFDVLLVVGDLEADGPVVGQQRDLEPDRAPGQDRREVERGDRDRRLRRRELADVLVVAVQQHSRRSTSASARPCRTSCDAAGSRRCFRPSRPTPVVVSPVPALLRCTNVSGPNSIAPFCIRIGASWSKWRPALIGMPVVTVSPGLAAAVDDVADLLEANARLERDVSSTWLAGSR